MCFPVFRPHQCQPSANSPQLKRPFVVVLPILITYLHLYLIANPYLQIPNNTYFTSQVPVPTPPPL